MIQRSVLRAIIALNVRVHGAAPKYENHGLDWAAGACSSHEWQSPINIDTILLADKPEGIFEFNYPIVNDTPVIRRDGSLELDLRSAQGQLRYEGNVYNLRRAIWHSQAEHLISEKRHPLELQLVHAHPFHPATLVILSVLFEVKGDAPLTLIPEPKLPSPSSADDDFNPNVAQVWDAVADSSISVDNFDLSALVGTGNPSFVEYTGSQTSPPCMEGVSWLVKKDVLPLAKTQVEAFAQVLHQMNGGHGNFRSVASRNSRRLRVFQGEKKVSKDPFVDAPPRDPLPLGPRPRTDGELQAMTTVHEAIRETNEAKAYFKKLRKRLNNGAYVDNVLSHDLKEIEPS